MHCSEPPGRHRDPADLCVHTTRDVLAALSQGPDGVRQAIADGRWRLEGKARVLSSLVDGLDEFDPMFKVVEP